MIIRSAEVTQALGSGGVGGGCGFSASGPQPERHVRPFQLNSLHASEADHHHDSSTQLSLNVPNSI